MPPLDDAAVVAGLRAGDEEVFGRVFEDYHPLLMRLAAAIVKRPALAEEVVQDAWVTMVSSLDDFEERSTLRTWMARVVMNRATTVAKREGRNVSFAPDVLASEIDEPAVDPSRFLSWGAWGEIVARWQETPEMLASRKQTRLAIEAALEGLPESQRVVVTLRDVEGFSSEEVCNALGISESNQRVLLHRGRCRVRSALERAIREELKPR
jgi:RNA polymerase sigma-70 factor (ECF subfamily)